MQDFPIEIKTTNNYQAKVTNPEEGSYHFEVTYPTAYEPFEWYDDSFKGHKKVQTIEGEKDNVEHEILVKFWELRDINN